MRLNSSNFNCKPMKISDSQLFSAENFHEKTCRFREEHVTDTIFFQLENHRKNATR